MLKLGEYEARIRRGTTKKSPESMRISKKLAEAEIKMAERTARIKGRKRIKSREELQNEARIDRKIGDPLTEKMKPRLRKLLFKEDPSLGHQQTRLEELKERTADDRKTDENNDDDGKNEIVVHKPQTHATGSSRLDELKQRLSDEGPEPLQEPDRIPHE